MNVTLRRLRDELREARTGLSLAKPTGERETIDHFEQRIEMLEAEIATCEAREARRREDAERRRNRRRGRG